MSAEPLVDFELFKNSNFEDFLSETKTSITHVSFNKELIIVGLNDGNLVVFFSSSCEQSDSKILNNFKVQSEIVEVSVVSFQIFHFIGVLGRDFVRVQKLSLYDLGAKSEEHFEVSLREFCSEATCFSLYPRYFESGQR